MTPPRARKLLAYSMVGMLGWSFGTAEQTFGFAPLFILIVIATSAWLAGWAWTWVRFAEGIEQANNERDKALETVAHLTDGGNYKAARPIVPRQART